MAAAHVRGRTLSLDGAQARALVVEKTIYAAGVESGKASACRYRLRVTSQDGVTSEISCRAFGHTLAAADVGDSIPVRYDPTDRSKIDLDRRAFVEQEEAQERDAVADRSARGETAPGLPSTATPSHPWTIRSSPTRAASASVTPIDI